MYGKVLQLCIYIYLFFAKVFSQLGCYGVLSRVSVLDRRSLMVFVLNIVVYTCQFQPIPLPRILPSGKHKFVLLICDKTWVFMNLAILPHTLTLYGSKHQEPGLKLQDRDSRMVSGNEH